MALPANLATRRVTGRWTRFDGKPDQGTVTLTPSVSHLYDAAADVVVTRVPITIPLDKDGRITNKNGAEGWPTPVTDDPDVSPLYSYELHIKLKSGYEVTKDIEVPAATESLDLLSVVPVAPVEETTNLVTSVNGESGAVTLTYDPTVVSLSPRGFLRRDFVFTAPNDAMIIGQDGDSIFTIRIGEWGELYESRDHETTNHPKGFPASIRAPGDHVAAYNITRFGGYLYLMCDEWNGTEFVVSIHRAAPTANASDPFTWAGPVLGPGTTPTTHNGSNATEQGLTTDGTHLLAYEYGDPLDGNGNPAASIYRSTDGTTWTRVFTGPSTMRHMHSVRFDPYVAGQVWSTSGDLDNVDSIMRSADHGLTWTTVAGDQDWQAVHIDFDQSFVYFSPDKHAMTLYVYDRTVGQMFDASVYPLVNIPVPPPSFTPRTFYDGSTDATAGTIQSASAGFDDYWDSGSEIHGQNIPDGTTISSVSGDTATLSQAPTASASDVIFTVHRPEQRWRTVSWTGALDPNNKGQRSSPYYFVPIGGRSRFERAGVFAHLNVGADPTLLQPLPNDAPQVGAVWFDTRDVGRVLRWAQYEVTVPLATRGV